MSVSRREPEEYFPHLPTYRTSLCLRPLSSHVWECRSVNPTLENAAVDLAETSRPAFPYPLSSVMPVAAALVICPRKTHCFIISGTLAFPMFGLFLSYSRCLCGDPEMFPSKLGGVVFLPRTCVRTPTSADPRSRGKTPDQNSPLKCAPSLSLALSLSAFHGQKSHFHPLRQRVHFPTGRSASPARAP